MSTTIKSLYGKQLKVSNYDSDGQVELKPEGDSGRNYRVAELLAALKSEGLLESVDIITELPTVHYDAHYLAYIADGLHVRHESPQLLRRTAAAYLSAAKHIENEEAAATRAKEAEAVNAKELAVRRNNIVSRHGAGLGAYVYSDLDVNGRHIVDTIRSLEDKLANA